jgi:two-component system CheB/CheR fusion protein
VFRQPKYAETIAHGRANDDRWHLRKDGRLLWVSGVMTLLRDESGQARACAKVMRDYTETKLAADALRESESRLRVALGCSRDGHLAVANPRPMSRFSTTACGRLMGLDRHEEVLTLDHFLQAVHPEDSGRVGPNSNAACRGRRVQRRVQGALARRFPALAERSRQGVHNDAGDPLFITGACVDVTTRKHNEEVLREADQKKDQFLALLAHELRNPLAPAAQRPAGHEPSAHDETTIANTAGHDGPSVEPLIRLIDDLLDVSGSPKTSFTSSEAGYCSPT